MSTVPQVEITDDSYIIPGLATAHSHAFQRALRGRTQRRATAANSFWSWRGLMYTLAEALDPDDIYAIARLAYAEMALSGITAVGEFHYVHHDLDGQPYSNRTETADACIRAAVDVGIRICLIRTAYVRGGYNKPLVAAQKRFSDPNIDFVLQDADTLRQRYADDPLVSIAVAAHSIRAVPIEQTKLLAAYATDHNLPFHVHVCEQRQELAESIEEHGVTPVQLLADHGILNERFVGVHATHLSEAEITALGQAEAMVCLCRSTERDLGDGLPQTADLVAAGAKLCVGIDSHVEGNGFEEIRAVELDERSRLEARHTVAEAPQLLDIGTRQGYIACGMGEQWQQDRVYLNRFDPALVGLDETYMCDGIIFGASPRAVERVVVDGNVIVENRKLSGMQEIIGQYEETMRKHGIQ